MAIINRDNRFMDLIRVIKGSKLQPAYKNILLKYVLDVKAGRRNNDFIDDEFLERLMLELITEYTEKGKTYNLSDLIESVKIIFPFSENTENYENLRNLFITHISKYEHLFNEKLFALFDNKKDYVDIVNIIFGDDYYEGYSDEIFDYAVRVATYCQNQDILKREIIAFINNIDKCDDIDVLVEESLEEAKKRVGIYPVDEKTLSLIANEAKKAQSLITKLENLQSRVNNYQKDVDTLTKKGIEELQTFIDKEKDSLIQKLDEYLLEIEKQLKESSDKVFKEILMDAQKKINEIKLMASSLSSRTTD